ncbi:NAD-dependent malic enzyme [Methanocella sp. CWC-04]|uniref:NAD-dependent malic enzyme n=1 Tax=Methanooceanicella nereidis TaxID=2052831 RepID=A0AAP2RBD3_9EURY|nr:NAD-dependent malic enzyme [Methanocella sp. CWC-04]MCD1294069.1 NAD-dependent malic enzyme [Methanocella sp. CWC-04]
MDLNGNRITKRGIELLQDPTLNKSTAFTEEERQARGLVGLIPDVIETEETQINRVMQQLNDNSSDLDRYIYLISLLDNDETLFYKVVMSDPAHFLPVIYSPTIGEACLKFGHIFQRPRGMYISIRRKGHVKEILRNWPEKDVRFICVTDGERILGLGDLGANGMGIPIGKLQLYTACAAVPPHVLLPVFLDMGTNNRDCINDPLYLGIRQTRPPAEEIYEFTDEFMSAVQEVFPQCCIHFEDWGGVDAINLLERYRENYCCFNDDIQGTSGVILAGIINALKIAGSRLKDQRILFLGAGSAAIGIADLIVSAMMQDGLTKEEAVSRIWLFDTKGLVESSRSKVKSFQKPYAHTHTPTRDFAEAIGSVKPTAIIGVSTTGKAFNRRVIETMATINDRPIIFALSNPTDHAECTPDEAYEWSRGRAIYAAGIQFPPVEYNGKKFVPSQANNMYVYPAIGMAVYATQAKRITDDMFIAAAHAVAEQVTQAELDSGKIYPHQSNILETELYTATKVAEVIFDKSLAGVDRPENIRAFIESHAYKPEYKSLM